MEDDLNGIGKQMSVISYLLSDLVEVGICSAGQETIELEEKSDLHQTP